VTRNIARDSGFIGKTGRRKGGKKRRLWDVIIEKMGGTEIRHSGIQGVFTKRGGRATMAIEGCSESDLNQMRGQGKKRGGGHIF